MSFDLDAIIAEEAEAEQPKPFEFTLNGEAFTLPGRLDLRALAFIDNGRYDRAVKALAGPEQWAKISASPNPISIKSFDALLGEWVRHCAGTTMGKSSGSGGRSKSTTPKSKPTSRSTTISGSPS